MMKTTFLLVRHGESLANKETYFAGQSDAPLLESGINQANLSAEFVKSNYKVDKIYSSDLSRAYSTAQCFSKVLGVDIIKDKALREIYAGEWEGKKHGDLPTLFPEEYGKMWLKHIGKTTTPGGESVKELGERVIKALENIAKDNPEKTVLITTHATPIRATQSIVEYGSVEKMEDVPWASNASVTEICYEDGKWTLVHASIDEHLQGFRTSFAGNI